MNRIDPIEPTRPVSSAEYVDIWLWYSKYLDQFNKEDTKDLDQER